MQTWDVKQPVRELYQVEPRVYQAFKTRAQDLREELNCCRLEVALMPAPEPMHENHMIRVAVNQNPDWYASWYWSQRNANGPRLDRRGVEESLQRIIVDRDAQFTGHGRGKIGLYDTHMRDIIREALIGENGFALYYSVCPVTKEFFTGVPF